MAEEMSQKICNKWVAPGFWTPVVDGNWCDICQKSSLWEATLWCLTATGATPWGKATCCRYGKNFVWRNLQGEIEGRNKPHLQVGMQ
jgi:hypothetical protein